MAFQELCRSRHSVRKYTGETISEETLGLILSAGILAPSGRNRRPVEFLVIHDPEKLALLSRCRSSGSAMIEHADRAIIVMGDKEKTDTWIEDCSIAMSYMQLQATECGVGSCWVQCRMREGEYGMAEDYIHDRFSIPDNYAVEAILALGIPESSSALTPPPFFPNERVHLDRF